MNQLYRTLIVDRPLPLLLLTLAVCAFFGYQAQFFKLDASADTMLLDNDADLRYYQKIKRTFAVEESAEADEYLLVSFEPEEDLFSDASLKTLRSLVDDLAKVEGVKKVYSILDAPLFHSPKLNMLQLASAAVTGLPTLEKSSVDRELARQELTHSPYFTKLVIDPEGKLTAMLVIFERDAPFMEVARRREDLKAKKYEEGLSPEETHELAELQPRYSELKEQGAARQRARVAEVRDVLGNYQESGRLFLGGVPMIVADMIGYVKNDLVTFGAGVLLFLVITLGIIFRRPRWVILPLLCCLITVLIMVGFLGLVDWPATVISSNFTSLLFIITMSMAIHVIVRYRELHALEPEADHRELVFRAASLVARPCAYCALTTMVGFGSLIVSGIQPVNDFGRMMFLGIAVAWIVCFTFFPALLAMLPRGKERHWKSEEKPITLVFARFTDKMGPVLAGLALVVALIGVLGISRLTVENRFIDYFKPSSEIYQGMEVIDVALGGTTPLEIVLTGEGKDYWFQPENMKKLRDLHGFLEAQPEIGKVLSLDTLMETAEGINDGKPLNGFLLNMLRRAMPEELKQQILRPFASEDNSQVRIIARIMETNKHLKREVLLGKIEDYLYVKQGFGKDEARITGLYVLYNNLLQSLFRSQITTIGVVFLAVWLMFAVLFRSLYLATIGLIPNVFPVLLVLGCLGLAGIPLDIMTITIAAITIGIAVDQTIHYIHRFKEEHRGNHVETMYTCHRSIGRAMYYTSVTIIAGFSILVLSNFNPTIYFGFFTAIGMFAAMLGSLTLLPQLLIWLKPKV